jgi:hypothetical protein
MPHRRIRNIPYVNFLVCRRRKVDQIYPDVTLVPILQAIALNGFDYHLYTNNYTPNLSATLGSFTEAVWPGYALVTVPLASFTLTGVASHLGSMIAPLIAFGNTTGANQNAYGFFVTDHVTTNLVFCARFDGAPIVVPPGGGGQIVPILACYSALAM